VQPKATAAEDDGVAVAAAALVAVGAPDEPVVAVGAAAFVAVGAAVVATLVAVAAGVPHPMRVIRPHMKTANPPPCFLVKRNISVSLPR